MADRNGDGFDDETGEPVADHYEQFDESGRYIGPRIGYDPRYGNGGGGGGTGSSGRASDFDEGSADIPIWGWLTGATGRRDAARAEGEAARNRGYWENLAATLPDERDLRVIYEEEGEIGPQGDRLSHGLAGAYGDAGSRAAQQRALSQLEEIYRGGGMTAADRARMELGRQEVGQAMRGTREADMAALQARGMGGSGAMMASLLNSQQAGAQALSQRDAQMQISAQERQDRALGSAASLAGGMRAQGFDEESTRRGAYDDFYREYEDYLRGREQRNTQYRNRTRESRRDASQQAYENRERTTAGLTGQYSGDANRAADRGRRQDENNQALTGALGTLLASIG